MLRMKMFSCLILIMLIIHVECKNKFARDMRKKIRDSNGGRPTGPAPRNNGKPSHYFSFHQCFFFL